MPLIRFSFQLSVGPLRGRILLILSLTWIECFLSCRYTNASLGGDDLTIHANVGCLQGSVLSPTLWCLVVNSLLEDLKSLNSFCIGYAYDVVIIVRGRFINTISNIVTEGLRCVERGCNKEGLSVNPQKTTMVAFTNKRTLIVENISFF